MQWFMQCAPSNQQLFSFGVLICGGPRDFWILEPDRRDRSSERGIVWP